MLPPWAKFIDLLRFEGSSSALNFSSSPFDLKSTKPIRDCENARLMGGTTRNRTSLPASSSRLYRVDQEESVAHLLVPEIEAQSSIWRTARPSVTHYICSNHRKKVNTNKRANSCHGTHLTSEGATTPSPDFPGPSLSWKERLTENRHSTPLDLPILRSNTLVTRYQKLQLHDNTF